MATPRQETVESPNIVNTAPTSVRSELQEALLLDLIGPNNDHAFARELLPESPQRWYLTGFLVPTNAPVEQKSDFEGDDEIDDGAADAEALDDQAPPDRVAGKNFFASSMGLSVLITSSVIRLEAVIEWGDYIFERGSGSEHEEFEGADPENPSEATPESVPVLGGGPSPKPARGFRRVPRSESVAVELPAAEEKPRYFPVPNSRGLKVAVTVRRVQDDTGQLAAGTKSVSFFLLNEREPVETRAYRTFAFQARLIVRSPQPFVPRPDLRGGGLDDWDEAVADVQYRDVFEYAVGHGVAAEAVIADEVCREVRSVWIPAADVERVAPAARSEVGAVELGMEKLASLVDGREATDKLMPLVRKYREWIGSQTIAIRALNPQRRQAADEMLDNARRAADRIEAGIQILADPNHLEAFRLANKAMARAARQRDSQITGKKPHELDEPTWRPFQLAFILMALRGLVDSTHSDRETVDLLFFPTGGGKTEAYLGLAAFTLVLRRLRHPGIRAAGMSILMRYTLRLLTLDQLGRAAALICALELERKACPEKFGEWPFEIGLWVGSAATPNRLGCQGYTGPGKDYTAYKKLNDFKKDSRNNPSPIPIENCPWCGTKFTPESFRLSPNIKKPLDLHVRCVSPQCHFSGDQHLPIVGVDEPIYRRLPCFVIATVDKFATLPWTGNSGALFGLVDRYDQNGFYGPCDPGLGQSLGAHLPAPDLIIQDELHLISGPLGTIAGLYETAIEELASRRNGDQYLKPKIIASTATVRRAESQVRALFGRLRTDIFPPPGPDRRDSFFARTVAASVDPARRYVGIAAQGRSLKVVLMRVCLALLGAGETLYQREGGKKNLTNPVDPYMTLLGYFNSLRELGGSRRIVEDEVRTRLERYGQRKRKDPADAIFSDRKIQHEVQELTSRVSTNDVAGAKRRLALPFYEDERVDVALATNMISVGLDITRLGLMVVLGQPKTTAEYIQSTSRVGRDRNKPGLVVTLLNVHKPRDRSHYERFPSYHATFYRAVEATSVTPFSPRALDRALAAALVSLCRHDYASMTVPIGASEIRNMKTQLGAAALRFAERAENHRNVSAPERAELRQMVLHRCNDLIDDWHDIYEYLRTVNTRLKYAKQESEAGTHLLQDLLDPDLASMHPKQRKFRANRSMRDVERNVEISVKALNDWQ